MLTSARNCLEGKIKEINVGSVNSEVILSVGTVDIVSIITNESVKKMNLKIGDNAFGLIKANSIILTKDEKLNISARNIINTDVAKVEYGAVNAEIIMTIGTNALVSIITKESADNLMIKPKDKILAIFKASSVIIGTK